jgi:hypothetical protein
VLAAGVLRSLGSHRCGHAVRFDRPLVCNLAARLITCPLCLPRFEAILKAQDRRVANGTDMQCDFCLRDVPDNWFHPEVVRVGQVVVHADVCSQCNARMVNEAVA